MNLSKSTINILVDMIENKLALIQIGDREELREVVALQNCLRELQLSATAEKAEDHATARGRRRKLSALIDEADLSVAVRKFA